MKKLIMMIFFVMIFSQMLFSLDLNGLVDYSPPKELCGYHAFSFERSFSPSESSNQWNTTNYYEDIKNYIDSISGNHLVQKLLYDKVLLKGIASQLSERFVYSRPEDMFPEIGDRGLNYTFVDLEHVYFLTKSPDFIIARYETPSSTPFGDREQRNYIYLAKRDTALLVDEYEIRIKGLKNIFNYCLRYSDDLNNMDFVCKAALILSMKYRFNPNYIIESKDDLGKAIILANDMNERIPKEVHSEKELYLVDMPQIDDWIEDWQEILKNEAGLNDFENTASLHPIEINYTKNEVRIAITIFSGYYSYSEIADWVIVISKDGELKSLDYVSKPIALFGNLRTESPYFIDYGNK